MLFIILLLLFLVNFFVRHRFTSFDENICVNGTVVCAKLMRLYRWYISNVLAYRIKLIHNHDVVAACVFNFSLVCGAVAYIFEIVSHKHTLTMYGSLCFYLSNKSNVIYWMYFLTGSGALGRERKRRRDRIAYELKEPEKHWTKFSNFTVKKHTHSHKMNDSYFPVSSAFLSFESDLIKYIMYFSVESRTKVHLEKQNIK